MLRKLDNDDIEEFIGLLYYITKVGTDGIDEEILSRYKLVINELDIKNYAKLYQKSFYSEKSKDIIIPEILRESIDEFDSSIKVDEYEKESNKLSEILNRNCLVYKGKEKGIYIDSNTSSMVIMT